MSITPRELAFFGGWRKRTINGGVHRWGDPRWRNQEFVPSLPSTALLPDDTIWLQTGVSFIVVNTGTATLTVTDPAGAHLSLAVPAGIVAEFVKGDTWHGRVISTAQIGSVWPSLVYDIVISSNASRINMLARVIDQFGYDGSQSAAVTCRILPGVAVGSSANFHRSITTGNTLSGVTWAPGSAALLIVEQGGVLGGWGGNGGIAGIGGTGSPSGFAGQNGGQAIRAEIPLRIDCAGLIFGGGGGGGGGGSNASNLTIYGGGGGGGHGVNMALGTGAIIGSSGGAGINYGSNGATFIAGAGGLGTNGGGNGGAGGFAAGNGVAGSAASPGASGGAGGTGGAAISYLPAAGAPVILSGGGNISGATVSEAS